MFHIFNDIEERRKFGGSTFIEIQYCRLSADTKLKKIVAVNSIQHWKDDSLYIHVNDIDCFIDNYGTIFNMVTYNNQKTGIVDIFGINYYTVNDIKKLIDIIKEKKPIEFQILVNWLENATQYNGVYLLGI